MRLALLRYKRIPNSKDVVMNVLLLRIPQNMRLIRVGLERTYQVAEQVMLDVRNSVFLTIHKRHHIRPQNLLTSRSNDISRACVPFLLANLCSAPEYCPAI